MHHLRPALGITLVLAAALSCTAILKPRDEVQRCGTPNDCEPTGDNRYVPLCVFDEEATGIDSTKVEKVCVASYKNIACGDMTTVALQDAIDDCGKAGDYPGCMVAGGLGCEPDVMGCMAGLVVNTYGVCDDPNAAVPAIGSAYINDPELDLEGQDLRDQFCRSYFCDDSFVCLMGSCVQCDPEAAYGMGGCGEVYRNGVLSPVYVSDYDEGECMDASTDTVTLGPCPA